MEFFMPHNTLKFLWIKSKQNQQHINDPGEDDTLAITFDSPKERGEFENFLEILCERYQCEKFFTSSTASPSILTLTFSKKGYGVSQGSNGNLDIRFPNLEMRNAVYSALALRTNKYVSKNDDIYGISFNKDYLVAECIGTSDSESYSSGNKGIELQSTAGDLSTTIETELKKFKKATLKITPDDTKEKIAFPGNGRGTIKPFSALPPKISLVFETAEDADNFCKLANAYTAAKRFNEDQSPLSANGNIISFSPYVANPGQTYGAIRIPNCPAYYFIKSIFPAMLEPNLLDLHSNWEEKNKTFDYHSDQIKLTAPEYIETYEQISSSLIFSIDPIEKQLKIRSTDDSRVTRALHKLLQDILAEEQLSEVTLSAITPGTPGKDNTFTLTFPMDFYFKNIDGRFLITEPRYNPGKYLRLFNFLEQIMKPADGLRVENHIYSVDVAKKLPIAKSLKSDVGTHLVLISPKFSSEGDYVSAQANSQKMKDWPMFVHKPQFTNQVNLYLADNRDAGSVQTGPGVVGEPRLGFEFQNAEMAISFIEKMKNAGLRLSQLLPAYPNRVYIEPYNYEKTATLDNKREDKQTRKYYNGHLDGKAGCIPERHSAVNIFFQTEAEAKNFYSIFKDIPIGSNKTLEQYLSRPISTYGYHYVRLSRACFRDYSVPGVRVVETVEMDNNVLCEKLGIKPQQSNQPIPNLMLLSPPAYTENASGSQTLALPANDQKSGENYDGLIEQLSTLINLVLNAIKPIQESKSSHSYLSRIIVSVRSFSSSSEANFVRQVKSLSGIKEVPSKAEALITILRNRNLPDSFRCNIQEHVGGGLDNGFNIVITKLEQLSAEVREVRQEKSYGLN
jgi:hypothetical protein